MVDKGRQARLKGVLNGHAKLTDAKVRELRQLRATGWSLQSLAARYGVHENRISEAARGKTWAHVS